jgi:hypothetical protein
MGNALFSSESGSGADRRVTRRRDQRRNQYRMAPFLPSNMLPFLGENSETPNNGLLSQFRMFRGGPSNNPINNPMDLDSERGLSEFFDFLELQNQPESTAPSSTEAPSDSAIQPDSETEHRSRRLPLIVIGLRAPDPASDLEARNSARNVPSNTSDSPSGTSRNDAQIPAQQPSDTSENATRDAPSGTPQQWMIYIVAATLHQDQENPEHEETEDEEPVTPVSPTDSMPATESIPVPTTQPVSASATESIPAPVPQPIPAPTLENTAEEGLNANRSNILSHLFEALQNQRDEMSNEPNPPSPSLNLEDASRIEMPAYMASLLGLISRVRGINTDRLDGYENLLQLAELLGPARPRNARMEDVSAQLPTFLYKNHQIEPIAKEEKTDIPSILIEDLLSGTSDKCSICLNEYSDEDELRVLKCKHGFHKVMFHNFYQCLVLFRSMASEICQFMPYMPKFGGRKIYIVTHRRRTTLVSFWKLWKSTFSLFFWFWKARAVIQ